MGLLNGKCIFKTLPDGSFDRTKVICRYYRRSTSSLKYQLLAEHAADAEILHSLSPKAHLA